MALVGMQFNDLDYKAEDWSDLANSKKWWKTDLNISYPSTNQMTINEGSRLYIADHRIKITSNETLSLPASAPIGTFYFYIEIDSIAKTYTLKFDTTSPNDGDLATTYNAVFGKHTHLGGALNLSFEDLNVNDWVDKKTNQTVNGVKTFTNGILANNGIYAEITSKVTNGSFVQSSSNPQTEILLSTTATSRRFVLSQDRSSQFINWQVLGSATTTVHQFRTTNTGVFHSTGATGVFRQLAFETAFQSAQSMPANLRSGRNIKIAIPYEIEKIKLMFEDLDGFSFEKIVDKIEGNYILDFGNEVLKYSITKGIENIVFEVVQEDSYETTNEFNETIIITPEPYEIEVDKTDYYCEIVQNFETYELTKYKLGK